MHTSPRPAVFARGALPLALAAVAVFYLWLAATRIGPLAGFWAGDQGVKLLQVQGLLATRYRSLALPYPGAALDRDDEFSPFRGQYLVRGKRAYPIFSAAFAAGSAPAYALFGPPGLLLLPALSTLVLLAFAGAIARRFLSAWGAAVLVGVLGAASPLLFYALVFWEHAPAAYLVTFGLWAALRGAEPHRLASLSERKRLAWLGVGGLTIALAAAFRSEAVLALPALAVGLSAPRPLRHPLRELPALAAGAAIGLGLLAAFQAAAYGTPLGPHVVIAAQATHFGQGGLADGLRQRLAWAELLLVPRSAGTAGIASLALGVLVVLAVIAALVARRSSVPRPGGLDGGRRFAGGATLLAALLVSAAAASLLTLQARSLTTSLLASFPFALLALLPVPREEAADGESESGRRTLRLLGLFAAVDIALALLANLPDGGSQWGPRMLLPAVPALGLVAAGRVAAWLRSPLSQGRSLRGPIVPAVGLAVGLAVVLTLAASLAAAARGVTWTRVANESTSAFDAAVAASGEQVIVSRSSSGVSLVAPLFYRDHLVFLTLTDSGMARLAEFLRRHGIDSFYQLWRRPGAGVPGIPGGAAMPESMAALPTPPGFTPAGPVHELPFDFEGRAFRAGPPLKGAAAGSTTAARSAASAPPGRAALAPP